MLHLFDGNNHARVEFEVDPTGLPLRRLFSKAYYSIAPEIYIFDGKNSKALRKAQYPEYKSKRKPPPDNFMIMLGFYKELLMHTNKVMIDLPGYEADDVIATICRRNPGVPITIHSTDRDFCALEDEFITVPGANLKGVARDDVRLYKTLCGDTSDSISGIEKFGPKAWAELTSENKAYWTEVLESKMLVTADYQRLGVTRPLFASWLSFNYQKLQIFWDIIGFYSVPEELIAQHTRVGTKDFELAESKLRDLLQ